MHRKGRDSGRLIQAWDTVTGSTDTVEPGTQTVLSHRRFDVDEYHRMARAGILTEDDRVELIDGEIVQMSAIGSRHASCVRRLTHALVPALGDAARVSLQNPVRLDRHSEPEPDVALLRPQADDYAHAHPGPEDVLLLVEVADASLPFDRGVKLSLYARAGITEVWIIDLTSAALEIHRDPTDSGYARHERLTSGRISPLELPDLELEITAIFPPGEDPA